MHCVYVFWFLFLLKMQKKKKFYVFYIYINGTLFHTSDKIPSHCLSVGNGGNTSIVWVLLILGHFTWHGLD